MPVLLMVAGFLLVLLLIYLHQRRVFCSHSLYVLALMAVPLSLLARFDIRFSLTLAGRPYWAMFGAMVLAAAVGTVWGRFRSARVTTKVFGALLCFVFPNPRYQG